MSFNVPFTAFLELCNVLLCKVGYLLVLQYPVGLYSKNFVYQGNKIIVVEKFTIHGYWIMDANGDIIKIATHRRCTVYPLNEINVIIFILNTSLT